MEIPQKIKIELPYDQVTPLLGIYPKECKTVYNRDTCTLMLITALFTISKLWNPGALQLMNGSGKFGIYTMEYY
jgi:hypothetical protein